MSRVSIMGAPLVFGMVEPLPMDGFPTGRVKIKMRNKDFVRVYVKTNDGIILFYVIEKDGKWHPHTKTARNIHTSPLCLEY